MVLPDRLILGEIIIWAKYFPGLQDPQELDPHSFAEFIRSWSHFPLCCDDMQLI